MLVRLNHRILTIHYFGVMNMSFLSKVELKRQLQALGIKVEGNYVRKADVEKVLAIKEVSNQDKKLLADVLVKDQDLKKFKVGFYSNYKYCGAEYKKKGTIEMHTQWGYLKDGTINCTLMWQHGEDDSEDVFLYYSRDSVQLEGVNDLKGALNRTYNL